MMRRLMDKKDRCHGKYFLCFSRSAQKKGATHFEMIISFVFFAGFTFFLFMVLKPHDTSILSGAVIVGLYDSFEEEVYTNLSSMFLRVNYSAIATDCFEIQLSEKFFDYGIPDKGSYVTRLSGEDVNSSLSDGNLNIKKDDVFLRVLISPEFEDEEVAGCEVLSDYELGQPVGRRVISYGALENMSNKYFSDYEELKSELRVPPIFDFSIVAENLPIKMEPQSGIPDSVEVMARDYVVGVLRSDGNLTNERFTLKVW